MFDAGRVWGSERFPNQLGKLLASADPDRSVDCPFRIPVHHLGPRQWPVHRLKGATSLIMVTGNDFTLGGADGNRMGSTRPCARRAYRCVVVRHSVDHKLSIGVAVPQQVGPGRFDLDTSIRSYVDLSGTTISGAVTVRQLLTSGIADDADGEAREFTPTGS